MSLVPRPEFSEAAKQLERLLSAYRPASYSDSWFLEPKTDLWQQLVDGGWTRSGGVGAREADLVDLLEFAEVWGRHLIPCPFTETLVLSRWVGHDSGKIDSPLTFATGSLSPLGGASGTLCLVDVAAAQSTRLLDRSEDSFASSLPLANVDFATQAPEECFVELLAMAAGQAVGAARRCCELTLSYSHERVAYGEPIGHFQAVKHLAANMYAAVELAKTSAVWASQASNVAEARNATLAGMEFARSAIEGAIQIHGGVGFTWELGLHRYLRHVLALSKLAASLGVQPSST